ncbi:MAG: zinc dependent phospholipase C family protein [Gemmatimonadaceae bacterium]|nr:zinc dependent phospholipase C family protein [Gemmatimonadaceae bacterium]
MFERQSAVSESASASEVVTGPRLTGRPGSFLLAAFLIAVVAIALTPSTALAWTPGTHIFLGEAIIQSLSLLPPHIAGLLSSYPYDFLYGSIAADTSIAKKYAAAGRHCHSWNVGMEIHDGAKDDPMRAFGLGYLAHLAADSVAHNYFVPHQLTITSSTAALGHSYWESRFDTHIGEKYSRRAREVILLDHARSDEHLDRILSPTIFSTPTNRRIFRGMVYVADTESWQRVFHMVSEKSRWDLTGEEVEGYVKRSFDFIVDLFNRFDKADTFALDPAGEVALRDAKRIRRAALRRGGEEHVIEEAFRNYGLPACALSFADNLPQRLYEPARDASS